MFRRLAVLGVLLAAMPAQASTMPSADLQPGHTLDVGYTGVGYDYAWNRFGLGGAILSDFMNPSTSQLRFGARGAARFIDDEAFKAAVIAGVLLDPGQRGARSYLVPDLGLGVAYHAKLGSLPFTLRLDVTLTVDQGQSSGAYPTPVASSGEFITSPSIQPNLLQRVIFGPNTNFGVGAQFGDRLEINVGGGTLVAVRYHY
ncbi:MAG: hypothetical protein JWM80_3607 [Cyanobacteria bacterium RYN_339]|nr:hypothetical protein [Cyanobacteria bacterium RYN_339]